GKTILYVPNKMDAYMGAESNSFVRDVILVLDYYSNSDNPIAQDVVCTLDEATLSYTIEYVSEGHNGTMNGIIFWTDNMAFGTNGTNPKTGSNKRPAASSLLHELIHNYFAELGTQLYNQNLDNFQKGKITEEEYEERITEIDKIYQGATDDNIVISLENAVNLANGWGIRLPQGKKSAHNAGTTTEITTDGPFSTEGQEEPHEAGPDDLE
ncbi:MAG: hypothetical protein KKA07_04985, partial [Bacteroidetes bacterium]|nr:hypothetical protein [Bacteroidota bacterium]